LLCSVEGPESGIKEILFQSRSARGRGPELHWVRGDFQLEDSLQQYQHRNSAAAEHNGRVFGAD